MNEKLIRVFYGVDSLPYKDKERTTHFPIVGSAFMGASNVTEIRFYVDRLGTQVNQWIVIGKLPNGKKGFKLLNSPVYDYEENEYYYSFLLGNFFTQAKGDLFISLGGYNGSDVELNEDDIYELLDNVVTEVTGTIKLNIAYAVNILPEDSRIEEWQELLAALGQKLDITNGIVVLKTQHDTLSGYDVDIASFDDGQIFYLEYQPLRGLYIKSSGSLSQEHRFIGLCHRAGTMTNGTELSESVVEEAKKRYCLFTYTNYNQLFLKTSEYQGIATFVRVVPTVNNSTYITITEQSFKLTYSTRKISDFVSTTYDLPTKAYLDGNFANLGTENVFDYAPQTNEGLSDASPTTKFATIEFINEGVKRDLTSHENDINNPHQVTKEQVVLGNVTNDAQVKRTEMGVALGVATLDANGKVLLSQLPDYITGQLLYGGQLYILDSSDTQASYYNLYDCGVLSISDNAISLLGLTPVSSITMNGITLSGGKYVSFQDYYEAIRVVGEDAIGLFFAVNQRVKGSLPNQKVNLVEVGFIYNAGQGISSIISGASTGDWGIVNNISPSSVIFDKLDNTDAVLSINGRTGAVVITKSDVGLEYIETDIAPYYDSASTYVVGDVVIYSGKVYVSNTDIDTAEEWNSSHWDETSVKGLIDDLKSTISNLNSKLPKVKDVVIPINSWQLDSVSGRYYAELDAGAVFVINDNAMKNYCGTNANDQNLIGALGIIASSDSTTQKFTFVCTRGDTAPTEVINFTIAQFGGN